MEPIIKWPGGKERELVHILSNQPHEFDNYYEPFVGGGAVFMALEAKNYFINDLSDELIGLYDCIKHLDAQFFNYSEIINAAFESAKDFSNKHFDTLCKLYLQFRNEIIDFEQFSTQINDFIAKNNNEVKTICMFNKGSEFFLNELTSTLKRKMRRMKVLEAQKGDMPTKDLKANIETTIKSSLYVFYRHLYNTDNGCDKPLKISLFFFLRNYAYSGMFRYNSEGLFNVPYGGIAYNNKLTRKKLEYYQSKAVQEKFARTTIGNLDFEEFLQRHQPTENDFVFLDPPYDTEFSTYAQHDFTKVDQQRLADYLTNRCNAKWMLIIKNTDFIYGLYANKNGINISSFDKEYTVSFMNRNGRQVTHLIIRNYV